MKHLLLIFVLLFSLSCASCNEGQGLFQSIANQFASPIAVAVDVDKKRAYVVNSNTNYDYTDTTLSILDITSPAAPVLLSSSVNPLPLPNFSGQIYFDTATSTAFVTNRLSDNTADTIDNLLKINFDESSVSFGTMDAYASGDNPFGIACCDTSGRIRAWVPNRQRRIPPCNQVTFAREET